MTALKSRTDDSTTPPQPTLRLLVIDDETLHCELIENALNRHRGFALELVVTPTIKEARKALDDEQFDCILLDHNLPDGRGVDLLEDLQELALTTPVIGISTSIDPEVALADFRGGCVEFLRKDAAFRGQALSNAVLEAIAQFRRRSLAASMPDSMVTRMQQQMITAARTDALTGLFNRAVYEEAHRELHQRAQAHDDGYALCVLDIDHFKQYNDMYGHAAGDEALHQVAHSVRRVIRDGDLVARYGGEEFVTLLERANREACERVTVRMLESIRTLIIPHAGNPPYGIVTISLGVAVVPAGTTATVEDVFRQADAALYDAKRAQRNCSRLVAVVETPEGQS